MTRYLGALAAFASALLGGIVSWNSLANQRLEVRIVVAIATGFLLLLSVMLVFNDAVPFKTGKRRRIAAALSGFVVATSTFVLLWLTAGYHSLISTDEEDCRAAQRGWRCVGLRAPSQPVSLSWRFRLDRRSANSVEWAPGYWSDEVGTPNTTFDERTLTVKLGDFAYPQRYGVSYKPDRLNGHVEDELQHVVPNTTTHMHLSGYRQLVAVFAFGGLALWVLASWSLYSSGRWLARFSPPDTPTPEP